MGGQPSGINITVSPSQLGGWNPMNVVFREVETDTVLRTIRGGNLPLPTVGEVVSFGNVTEVTETDEAKSETSVDMDPDEYIVVNREFTYLFHGSIASAESSEMEVTIDISLQERTGSD